MDGFNLWELFAEHPEVFEAHELRDGEREPHFEEPSPTVFLPPRHDWQSNNYYTAY